MVRLNEQGDRLFLDRSPCSLGLSLYYVGLSINPPTLIEQGHDIATRFGIAGIEIVLGDRGKSRTSAIGAS